MKQNHGIVCIIIFFSFLMNDESFSQMDETKINLALVQMTVEASAHIMSQLIILPEPKG